MKPHREKNPVPAILRRLRDEAASSRGRIIRDYTAIAAPPAAPPYQGDGKDIIASHILRSGLELAAKPPSAGQKTAWRAHTRDMVRGLMLTGCGGALSEICVGVMAETLSARGRLHVAAGFFSNSIACADDFLDREGMFDSLGPAPLFYLSHAYRDLVDMALEEGLKGQAMTSDELRAVRLRLFDVIKTLAGSEKTADPDAYLYEKSCGDKVIGVLFPASGADSGLRETCAGIGRLVGEAGQLIDDIMDCEGDLAGGKKNHIIMSGSDAGRATDKADGKITRARRLTALLPQGEKRESIVWILDALAGMTGIFKKRLERGVTIGPSLLDLSGPLNRLLGGNVIPAGQVQMWF